MKGLRILIAEDHEVVRRGIRCLLEDRPEWKICGEAVTVEETIEKTKTLRPDLLLLDVTMPDMDAVKAIPQIIDVCPTVKIVALAMQESAESAANALAAGADGLALKSEPASDLLLTVQHIGNGQPFLSPAAVTMIGRQLLAPRIPVPTPGDLTPRDVAILESMVRGSNNEAPGSKAKTLNAHRMTEFVAPDGRPLAAREPDEKRRPANRGRVLLVEADADIRNDLLCLLNPHYDVTAAANGQDALTSASANPPDLVLCDVMMPVLNGLGPIEALRADPATSTLPIILFSARMDEEAQVQGLATRADDYLAKPFTARELLSRVEVHLSLSHMRKQEARRAREAIEAELKGMTRLHEVASRLLAAPDLRTALEEILVATCTMMSSRMGNVQVYDPRTQTLTVAAQQGFSQDVLDRLGVVRRDSPSACRAAMNGGRVIIEDVNGDESFRPLRETAASACFRSLQSTPLLNRTGALLGVLSTYWSHPHRPSEHDLYMLDLYAHQAADVLEHIQTAQELQRSFDQLRALAARLQSVREEERMKVAREIHDELGQGLTAIKMELNSLLFEWPAEQKPSKRTESITRLVDQAIQSVRKISTELRPGILDALGLVAAVEWAAAEFETRTGTRCRIDLPKEALQIDQERATAIFRIFQETLTNIARHAGATQADIRLAREADGSLILDVHDNGIGCSEERLAASGSLGILGMQERALLLGGEFLMSGVPNQGTRVLVRIPLSASLQGEQVV
jgi:signal transduction histidine kinase